MNAFIFFPKASRAWRALRAGLVMGIFALCATAQAHGYDAGEVRIDHPYATPSPPGELSAQVYFRALKNRGHRPDKLLSARTSVATGMAWQHIDTTKGGAQIHCRRH